jgi:hypothetical protein
MPLVEKSHGRYQNDGFPFLAHFIGSRLHIFDDGYNFHGIHIEATSKKSFCPIRRSKMPLAVRRTSIGVEPSSSVFT